MSTNMYTKKDLLAAGFSATLINSLTPVDAVKTGKRGRPAALFSQEQFDALKAGTVTAKGKAAAPATVPAEIGESNLVETGTVKPGLPETDAPDAAEAMLADTDLSEADFAAAAA